MNLYLLRPVGYVGEGPLPTSLDWKPPWDKAFGFVVRAKSEHDARLLASKQCGDEREIAWTKCSLSSCVVLSQDGECGVIIRDFCAG